MAHFAQRPIQARHRNGAHSVASAQVSLVLKEMVQTASVQRELAQMASDMRESVQMAWEQTVSVYMALVV